MLIYHTLSGPGYGSTERIPDNVGKWLITPPSAVEGKKINFINWLWTESSCAIHSLLLNILGTMHWILYWQMYCWLLAACAFLFKKISPKTVGPLDHFIYFTLFQSLQGVSLSTVSMKNEVKFKTLKLQSCQKFQTLGTGISSYIYLKLPSFVGK